MYINDIQMITISIFIDYQSINDRSINEDFNLSIIFFTQSIDQNLEDVNLSIFQSINLSFCLAVHLSIDLSINQSINLSILQSIKSTNLSSLSIYLSIILSIC